MNSKNHTTFDNFDRFGLKGFCERLEAFATVEHDYVEGGLVMALNAGFGSGKTTFIEMWRNSLIERRDSGEFVPMPVILNAWESDHCGEPLLAILAGLVVALENWSGSDAPEKGRFKRAAAEVGWFATGLANEFVAKWTGLNAIKAEEYSTKKTGTVKNPMPDFVAMYQHRVDALKSLKEELRTAFGGSSPKVLIFVDELDRCRPDYAVSYLETIKHVFDIEGIVFILAVDYGHLKGAAVSLYGKHLHFEEYFRKFCHRTFSLPEPSEGAYLNLVQDYVGRYLSIEGKRMTRANLSQGVQARIVELALALRLRPRQIQEAFRIMGHTMQTQDEANRGNIKWGYPVGCALLSALRVGDELVFHQFRFEKDGLEVLCSKLVSLLGGAGADWWIKVVLAGSWSFDWPENYAVNLLRKLGYEDVDHSAFITYFGGFSDAWSRDARQLLRIADVIEEIRSI